MPLSRFTLSSIGLAVTLSISGQPGSSGAEPWGGAAWERYQGSGYEAGRSGPGERPYEGYPHRSETPGATPGVHQEPSWTSGDPSIPGVRRAGFGDYRDEAPYAWGQVGFPEGLRQDPRGAYAGSGPERTGPSGLGWQGASDYRPDDRDDAFRSPGHPNWSGFGPGQMRPLPGVGRVEPTGETYPGYRFRGDPPAYPGHWQSATHESGYRFRPLTDQERWRLGQGPEFRPDFPQGLDDPPFPGDPSLQPEAAYGFEPSPWRGR